MTKKYTINRLNSSLFNSFKLRSILKSLLKYLGITYIIFTLLIFAFVFWIYQAYLTGPTAFNRNEYHPFRSEAVKKEFLEDYESKAKEWPIASEERMVHTTHGQTFVRISGPKDAPPLVLLHGGGKSSLMWKQSIEGLSKNYRTYAIDDIYDWGRSVYQRRVNNPEAIAKWLDEVFTELELGDSINLAGYSYGGWRAAQYLMEHPERLRKIVLISPAGTVFSGNTEFYKQAMLGFLPHPYFMRKALYFACENMVQTEEGREQVEDLLEETMLAVKSFKVKIPQFLTVLTDEELRSIKVPLFYLDGEDNKVISPEKAKTRLHRLVTDVQTEIIPNAGHGLVFTHTEEVNKRVLNFLSK